jgi:hypothetical protein
MENINIYHNLAIIYILFFIDAIFLYIYNVYILLNLNIYIEKVMDYLIIFHFRNIFGILDYYYDLNLKFMMKNDNFENILIFIFLLFTIVFESYYHLLNIST